MDSLKDWARGVYLLAVFSSAAILIIPKCMQKQSKFVIELLMLLCIMAPVARFAGKPLDASSAAWNYREHDSNLISLETFYTQETGRRVKEMAISAGLPVDKVSVEALGFAPRFSCRVTLYLSSAPDRDVADSFARFLSSYLSIGPEDILFDQSQHGGE